ncbi:complement resistance protein TraT [Francisellaceae bacterium]|nr:complement resistance protein TraT [Francisellaceae bacterium]
MKTNKKLGLAITMAAIGSQLTGCSAISTAIKHHSLHTQSKMSNTIFLDPISNKDKTILIQVRDTSSQKVHLKEAIARNLVSEGWTVTNDIDKAHDMVQVNVLQAGKAPNPAAVWGSMNQGFGNVLLGGLSGVTAGILTHSAGIGLGVGAASGAVGWLADQMVSNVTYSMITDIQVSIRVKGNVSQNTESKLSQGTETTTTQTYHQKTNWLRYKTRIASVADKVNLEFKDAKPILVKEVSSEISGIFS